MMKHNVRLPGLSAQGFLNTVVAQDDNFDSFDMYIIMLL